MTDRLNYEEVDSKITAFDEWLEEQSEAKQNTVYQHIANLVESIPHLGEKSAKILLSEVYLLARRHIHIENKYGEKEK